MQLAARLEQAVLMHSCGGGGAGAGSRRRGRAEDQAGTQRHAQQACGEPPAHRHPPTHLQQHVGLALLVLAAALDVIGAGLPHKRVQLGQLLIPHSQVLKLCAHQGRGAARSKEADGRGFSSAGSRRWAAGRRWAVQQVASPWPAAVATSVPPSTQGKVENSSQPPPSPHQPGAPQRPPPPELRAIMARTSASPMCGLRCSLKTTMELWRM